VTRPGCAPDTEIFEATRPGSPSKADARQVASRNVRIRNGRRPTRIAKCMFQSRPRSGRPPPPPIRTIPRLARMANIHIRSVPRRAGHRNHPSRNSPSVADRRRGDAHHPRQARDGGGWSASGRSSRAILPDRPRCVDHEVHAALDQPGSVGQTLGRGQHVVVPGIARPRGVEEAHGPSLCATATTTTAALDARGRSGAGLLERDGLRPRYSGLGAALGVALSTTLSSLTTTSYCRPWALYCSISRGACSLSLRLRRSYEMSSPPTSWRA
jgi:hypothetical protein